MEKFVKGDIIVISFPFSDLSGSKKRPALILADLQGDNIILCQITSQQTKDKYAIPQAQRNVRSARRTSSFGENASLSSDFDVLNRGL